MPRLLPGWQMGFAGIAALLTDVYGSIYKLYLRASEEYIECSLLLRGRAKLQFQQSGTSPSMGIHGSGWRTRVPFFYGWIVVGSIFFALAISYGVYYTFSIFYVALLEEFGWSRAATAGVFSVFVIIVAAGGAVAGALIDRFGPGRVVPTGGVLLALGLVATSRVTELRQFYLYFGLICGLGLSWAGWVPCVTLSNRWFSAKRGVALGVASAGIGFGTVAVVPFTQYLISSIGWRSAYLALAAMSLLIVPQAAYLLKGRPEELGLRADGIVGDGKAVSQTKPAAKPMVVVDQKWALRPWTVATAAATSRFWLMAGTFGLGVLTNQMLWVHQAAYLVDGGFDKMLAASTVGLAGLASMPAKVMWGTLGDRIGRELTYSIGVTTMVVAIILLVLTRTYPAVWMVLLFAVAFAFGYAVTAPIGPVAAADIFGGRNFGSIFGVINLATGFGSAAGAWFAGYVFDVTGSYVAAFIAAGASSIVASICLWLAAPRGVRRVPGRRAESQQD